MSDMDEPEEAIDSTSDDVSDSGTDSSVMETAASQGESDQNDSQKSGEFTAEAPVESDNVMDKKVIQESHDDEYEDDDSEDDEYEDDSEEDDSEDDEYEDDSEEDELEDDEYEDESEEDDERDDESEDGEYEYESEEDDERDDESEDDEYEDESEEDDSEGDEHEDESEDDERDDESEEDELEEDELEDDELEDDELEDEDESEEYEDDSEEDDSDDEEVEGLGDGDVALAASTDVGGDGEIADDVLAHESQHPAMHESGAEPILQSEVSDRVASSGVNGEDEARALAAGSAKHAELQFQAVDLPIMHGEPFGMRRADRNGCELLDAMAGRNSVFGFGCTPIRESLVSGLSDYLGEGSRFADVEDAGESVLSKKLQQVFDGASSVSVESMALLPSPDLAVEYALQLTRRFRSEKAFRTIALTGSDHGRTGMCRTASGQPQLHEGLGPMMAGFSHLPVGDLDALRASMDEQTAGVLLSPLDLGSGAVACEAEYLAGVRAACNERGALLIIDETQLVFGATGNHFSFSSIADIHADIVVTSSGLFAGLSGGLVLASQHASTRVVRDLEQYPLVAAALMATLDEMELHGLPDNVHDSAQELAVLIAERLSGFEFVRDMRVTGMTIGIECDVNAIDVVAAAAANGLRVETAGDTAIRIQPPLLISEEDRQLLLKRLVETMEAIERETAELTL
ncbi:MAG: aminotransferase class III-fold pyridoxal phosphate-dependent enzyme [Rubripirellula sp.]